MLTLLERVAGRRGTEEAHWTELKDEELEAVFSVINLEFSYKGEQRNKAGTETVCRVIKKESL